MSRGAYAYRDLDEEIFAPPECTHHQLQLGGVDACGGYYQSHSSPLQLSKASGHSESTILRRHLAMRRARRNKIVLVGGIAVLLVSTALLCVLSKLPPADKSALDLVIGAPYGALRRSDATTGGDALKNSASAPVSQEEAAVAADAMAGKRWGGVMGPGVGDDDPYDPQLEQMEVPEADEQQEEGEEKDPYDPDEEEEDGEGVENDR